MIKKEIKKNVTAAIGLQFASSLIPLITLPLLARKLGVTEFGKYSLALASIQYFISITEYSFNIITTRHIAKFRNEKNKISEFFSNTFGARILLGLLSFLALLILSFSVSIFYEIRHLLMILYLSIFGAILSPVYFFQGIGKLYTFTLINIFFRSLTIPFFIFLVKGENAIIQATIIQSLSVFLPGLFSIFLVYKTRQVKWVMPSFCKMKELLKEGFRFFLSNTANLVYSFLNVIIIARILNNTAVGYFAPAEKIIRASTGFFGPVSQAIFPGMISLMQESKEKAKTLLKKIFYVQLSCAILIFIGIVFFGKIFIVLLFGKQYEPSYRVMLLMSPTLIFMALSNLLSFQILIPRGYDKAFTNIMIFFGLTHIVFISLLAKYYGINGAAISVSLTEFLIAMSMIIFLSRIKTKT